MWNKAGCLRSCLFNYFVNDLHDIFDESCGPLKLENTHLTFADDLVIFSNSHKGLQNALNKLQKYCFDWQLTVNTNKSKILIFQKVYTSTPAFLYNDQPLTETLQYNFLGTIIDHKGCFKSGIQELSKKGLKVLFSMRKIFSNFEQLPVNLSCKLFDTLLRPILTYNCEIWYMEDYLPIYRALIRADKNNKTCDTLSLEDKTSYEKIHTRNCKTILGL